MKSASLRFLKNAFPATEVRLFVGRCAITLSTSSVTGVSSVNKGSVMVLLYQWKRPGPLVLPNNVIGDTSPYHSLRDIRVNECCRPISSVDGLLPMPASQALSGNDGLEVSE